MNYHLFASNISLVGTGDYFGCRRALKPLLSGGTKDERITENFLECSDDTLYELPANFTVMPFYGFSEFWYSMNDVLGVGGNYRKTLFDNQAAVSLLCCASKYLPPVYHSRTPQSSKYALTIGRSFVKIIL